MNKYLSSVEMHFLRGYMSGHSAGHQVNINHDGCPAGKDTKQRLYVKVTDDGKMVLAFCHHCSQRGAIKRSSLSISSTVDVPKGPVKSYAWHTYEKSYLIHAKPLLEKFHELQRQTPLMYLIGTSDDLFALKKVDAYGMRATLSGDIYVPLSGDIYVPYFSGDEVIGLDIRSGAKWFHHRKGSSDSITMYLYDNNGSDTCVICEDPFSAMKVDMAGYAGVSLGGSNVKTYDLLKLSNIYDKCVVWLDNDSALILEKATDIFNRAKLFFDDNVRLQDKMSDPKKVTFETIQKVCKNEL